MKTQTKFHGEIEIKMDELYTFESGLPGFLEEKQFGLLPLDGTPFYVLQSVESAAVAFIVTNPFEVFPDYEVKLTDEILSALHIESEQDVLIFSILNIRDPFENTTINLHAPVIINDDKKVGKQFIMNNSDYEIRQLLITPPKEQEVK